MLCVWCDLCVWCGVVCVQDSSKFGLDNALEATMDAQEWRLEVERVLPSLKIQVRQDERVRQ